MSRCRHDMLHADAYFYFVIFAIYAIIFMLMPLRHAATLSMPPLRHYR